MALIILGVDPGTKFCGFGIVEYHKNKSNYLESGCLELPAHKPFFRRLEMIYDEISDIIKRYKPAELAIENIFYSHNITTALKLGHARCAVILAALHEQVNISEYTPREMKLAVTGRGAATKDQVQFMVKQILRIGKPMSLDESDALGLALCHTHRLQGAMLSKGTIRRTTESLNI
jgi:crossover junction endodeoxyribonuclease RuvC